MPNSSGLVQQLQFPQTHITIPNPQELQPCSQAATHSQSNPKPNIKLMAAMDSMASIEEIIRKTITYVEEHMSHYDGSHDFNHIKRVVSLAHQIHNELQLTTPTPDLSLPIITLSALLHDIGDKKYLKPGQVEETMVLDLLKSFGATDKLAQSVQTICIGVSYTSEIKDTDKVQRLIEQFPELAIVQDADRLDAIGAVGIGRLFTYGGAKTDRDMQVTMAFMRGEGKMLRLQNMMKTEPGKKMAVERTERLLRFRAWWDEEVCGSEDALEGLI